MTTASPQELFRDFLFKVAPSLLLSGVHTYTVTRDNAGTLDLAPGSRVLHGPHLRVEQYAGPGIEAGLSVGDKVLLVFIDNDKGQPAIIGHLPLRTGKPGSLKIDATGAITIGESASTINIGGPSAVSLAKSAEIITWAALVRTSVNQAATYINGIAPGTVVPLASLASPATTKAKGV